MARSTVLVVEDEPEVAEVILEALTRSGCRCVHARDAEEADRALAEQPVEAVTLDLCMPGRGGLEWLEATLTTRPDVGRRTVVVTGTLLDEAARRRVMRCGAALLQKPVSLKLLVKEVHERLRATRPPTPAD